MTDSSGDWSYKKFQEGIRRSMYREECRLFGVDPDDTFTFTADLSTDCQNCRYFQEGVKCCGDVSSMRGTSPDAFIHDDLTDAVIDLDPSRHERKNLLFGYAYGRTVEGSDSNEEHSSSWERQRRIYEEISGFQVKVERVTVVDNSIIDLDPSDWREVPILKELPEGRKD